MMSQDAVFQCATPQKNDFLQKKLENEGSDGFCLITIALQINSIFQYTVE